MTSFGMTARSKNTPRAKSHQDIDALLGQTIPRPRSAEPPTKPVRKPLVLLFRDWASSQVAAYRVGLVLGYLAMMYFGTSAFIAGIPTFEFTTPRGWTPIWSAVVVIGGLIGGIGSLRAGTEPLTREVRVFNRIELTGAILLFLTLSTYATVLLILGYGYGDAGRSSVGAGFVALGIHPSVRMIWLSFRPRFLAFAHSNPSTAPVVLIPTGYALVKVDKDGTILPETAEENTARLSPDDAAHHNETSRETANRLGLQGD